MTLLLNRNNLPEISKKNSVITPNYNIDDVEVGIVHFGPSDFFRGHLAVFADDLLNMGHMDCGIVGVSINSGIERRDILSNQDNLYTVLERENGIETARVIGSLKDVLVGSEDPKAVINLMASPATKLVTMTVTEAGYNYHPDKEKDLDFENENIRESLINADQPRAVIAYIVEALDVRRKNNLSPFAIMSCDNMEHNGERLRRAVLAYAEAKEPELKTWIAHNATFLNTMVDRIVPKLDKTNIDKMATEYGVQDNWPIVTERFKQLVIGCDEKTRVTIPALDLAGAQFVPDVTPYELAKIRILNGVHVAAGLAGRIQGHTHLDDFLKVNENSSLSKMFMTEARGTLRDLDNFDYKVYTDATYNRLVNSHDQLQRLCRSGSTKLYTRVLSPIRDAIAHDMPHQTMMNVVADWVQYLKLANDNPDTLHDTENGLYIEDSKAYERGYVTVAKGLNGDVSPMLSLRDLWNGMENDARFVDSFLRTYKSRHGNSGHSPAP